MKKFRAIACIMILLSLSLSLFAAGIGEPVVLYLHGYIPERTTFTEHDGLLIVQSNTHNFTYTMTEYGFDRTVAVIAN